MTEPKTESEQNVLKKKAFRISTFRGIEVDRLLEMKSEELTKLFRSRHRRRINRKITPKYGRFINKLRKAKRTAQIGEKPKIIKTHYRDCIIFPEMIQSMVGIYTGKKFNDIEIKPEMVGHYLGEFAATYSFIVHGKPGQGSTHGSKFVSLI